MMVMGEVLTFARSDAAQRARNTNPRSAPADILFFTGVRYVRHDDTPPGDEPGDTPLRAPRSRARKRRA